MSCSQCPPVDATARILGLWDEPLFFIMGEFSADRVTRMKPEVRSTCKRLRVLHRRDLRGGQKKA
ncbi:hypothetical protein CG51_11445 [Haematobacter missouriensis]|nr:hypothetical protein CG51_11445 [Haematobacter missouriensis]